jgi:hypothetical protein
VYERPIKGILIVANKIYLLLSESDQGGVNNLHDSKNLTLHNEKQIIDSSRERGRCCIRRGRGLIHQDLITQDNTDSPIENGQIVIKREISDGTIHKGGGDKDYELVGGYSSGKQIDVIRVNMAKMGVIIQNPKDLFTEWSNEDYNAIADNLNTKANELYASAEKDSKAITSGITDSVKRGEHFMSIAMGAAQKAVAQDQMMQSIAQAYLTGGMAGIQQMVKDKIRDAFIDKVAEATGINPDLVRFASGRFEQAKLNKKMNSQAGGLGSGAGAVMGAGLMMAMGPVGPLMMAGPLGATALGAGAGGKLGSKMISGGTMANLVNNPMVQAGITAVAGPGVGMMVNKALQKTSFVQNNNQLNALKQQENALIQDAAGQAVANAIGRPDAAGNFSQILGGLKKRQVAKRDNANLGKVVTKGIASALNMGSGMIKGIVKNAVIAVGGSGETFDQLTASPFTPPATWTGAAKFDMSKEGWKDRLQEKAMADFLEANGMDRSLATTVASTTNAKIKAKKAKKEEKTKAIESTAQTALAITAIVLTAGAAAPAVVATSTASTGASAAAAAASVAKTTAAATTAATVATTAASFTATISSAIATGISTLGAVVTGTASVGNYVQVASIALQAAIGSRTGGVEGAMAGAANGILQAFAGSLGSKEAGAIKDKADLIAKEVSAGRMTLKAGAEALEKAKLVSAGVKAIAATNVSYTKKDGWGIKANVSGLVQSLGVNMGATRTFMDRFANVTIGQSQRGGASLNLGFNTGAGTLGVNYTGASGKFDGSFDVMERQAGTGKLSAELNYGEDGFSISGNADLGNGLGFGLESGRNGTTGSLTILGSQQGTVDEDGNYEANSNFLGEISGQDIIDLNEARQAERDAAENERNPVKNAKDAKNAKNAADAKEARDDDAKEVGGEDGPSGLVDLAFAGLGVVMSAGAAFLAGGGSSSASPSSPAGGQGGAGNGGNATVGRKPDDEDTPQDGDDEHKKKAAAEYEKSLRMKEEARKRQAEMKPYIEVEGLAQASNNKKQNTGSDMPQGYAKKPESVDPLKDERTKLDTEKIKLEATREVEQTKIDNLDTEKKKHTDELEILKKQEQDLKTKNGDKTDLSKVGKEIALKVQKINSIDKSISLVNDTMKPISRQIAIQDIRIAQNEYNQAKKDFENAPEKVKKSTLWGAVEWEAVSEAKKTAKVTMDAAFKKYYNSLDAKAQRGDNPIYQGSLNPMTGQRGGIVDVGNFFLDPGRNFHYGDDIQGGSPNLYNVLEASQEPKVKPGSITSGEVSPYSLGSQPRGIYVDDTGKLSYTTDGNNRFDYTFDAKNCLNKDKNIESGRKLFEDAKLTTKDGQLYKDGVLLTESEKQIELKNLSEQENQRLKVAAENNRLSSHGNSITIQSKDGNIEVKVLHLAAPPNATAINNNLGKQSDSVSLGIKGSTGKSTGPHNHMEVRITESSFNEIIQKIENHKLGNFKTEDLEKQNILLKGKGPDKGKYIVDPIFFLNKIQPVLNLQVK